MLICSLQSPQTPGTANDAAAFNPVDWGNVHLGDTAVDLSIAHRFLPPAARDAFRRAYGATDEGTWRLARFRALYHAAIIVVYAHEVGDEDLLREELTSLRHVLID